MPADLLMPTAGVVLGIEESTGTALTRRLGYTRSNEPGGNPYGFPIPPNPALAGIDVMLQGLVLTPQADNGLYGTTDATRIRIH